MFNSKTFKYEKRKFIPALIEGILKGYHNDKNAKKIKRWKVVQFALTIAIKC